MAEFEDFSSSQEVREWISELQDRLTRTQHVFASAMFDLMERTAGQPISVILESGEVEITMDHIAIAARYRRSWATEITTLENVLHLPLDPSS